MLSQRIITALALLSALLFIVFFTNPLTFLLILSAVALLAVWEWSKLSGIESVLSRSSYCFVAILLGVLSYTLIQDHLFIILSLSLCFWAFAFLLICTYPNFNSYWNNPYSLGLMGILVLLPCWFMLIFLRSYDDFVFNFLTLIALVAAADIGAYFSGKKFGKHKLARLLSPNKTWEGVFGGVLSCFVITAFISFIKPGAYGWLVLISLPFFVSFFSVVGDLFESMLKRVRGVKDSGNILPGHGGILDRVDGIVSTTPAYILILVYFI
ncbi:MAG: phosphatidate cytidylyltransferase [Gammaproteobacteria bacterium]|jgi:phosphatidate cytidylyltransferase|nr:phosphatidate cytidylyltransferase [Gammaproteobacteria bacterium]